MAYIDAPPPKPRANKDIKPVTVALVLKKVMMPFNKATIPIKSNEVSNHINQGLVFLGSSTLLVEEFLAIAFSEKEAAHAVGAPRNERAGMPLACFSKIVGTVSSKISLIS